MNHLTSTLNTQSVRFAFAFHATKMTAAALESAAVWPIAVTAHAMAFITTAKGRERGLEKDLVIAVVFLNLHDLNGWRCIGHVLLVRLSFRLGLGLGLGMSEIRNCFFISTPFYLAFFFSCIPRRHEESHPVAS